jgi:hypothetical protein
MADLDPAELVVWASKMIWGVVWSESRLRTRRDAPDSPPIASSNDLALLAPVRNRLRAWRESGETPEGSILVFPAQVSPFPRDNFDYLDSPPTGVVSLRLDSVAVVISTNDHGDLNRLDRTDWLRLGYLPVFTELGSLEVNTLQFRELHAWVLTAHYSRPPFPPRGHPFGPYDDERHREMLHRVFGPAGYTEDDVRSLCMVFNADLSPRYLSVLETRRAAAEKWGSGGF